MVLLLLFDAQSVSITARSTGPETASKSLFRPRAKPTLMASAREVSVEDGGVMPTPEALFPSSHVSPGDTAPSPPREAYASTKRGGGREGEEEREDREGGMREHWDFMAIRWCYRRGQGRPCIHLSEEL